MKEKLPGSIFNIKNKDSFSEAALKIFKLQAEKNEVYREFVSSIGKSNVRNITDIPFLPCGTFKNRIVTTGNFKAEMVFESRTTGTIPSRHFVQDLKIYRQSFIRSFKLFYGNPEDYMIAALLPSYAERENSSLTYMVDSLIKKSRYSRSGFYHGNSETLIKNLQEAVREKQKAILIGVSFALLDLSEKFSPDLSGIIVMETGGMKGRRKELTRTELHSILTVKLNVPVIHSEYGMTELLSQAYSQGRGIFYSPPWMKIFIRDPHDPLSIKEEYEKPGGLNIIDLANINSCSFIATEDYGILYESGGFEVMGRFDSSEIRGCNLMAEG